MKILILCDHYPLSPRVKKIRNSLLKNMHEAEIQVFAWNRAHVEVEEDFVISFDQEIGYGNRLNKIKNFKKFISHARKYSESFKADFIHAIDLDMLIATMCLYKNSKLIYEVYDIKFLHNKILNSVREKIEAYIMNKKVDGIILASPFFECYYKKIGVKKVEFVVINNKPNKNILSNQTDNYLTNYNKAIQNKSVIGFVGKIRYKEILINLIESIKYEPNTAILLAGDGADYDYINKYINENELSSRVIMTGRYDQANLKTIYDACDYIWAAYPNKNLNVKYAISNKFFESLIFNKNIIVSNNTEIGRLVKQLKLGYTVDPYNRNNIMKLISSLDTTEKQTKKFKVEKNLFWEDEEQELEKIYKI